MKIAHFGSRCRTTIVGVVPQSNTCAADFDEASRVWWIWWKASLNPFADPINQRRDLWSNTARAQTKINLPTRIMIAIEASEIDVVSPDLWIW